MIINSFLNIFGGLKMVKILLTILVAVVLGLGFVFLSGCESSAGTGAGIGALAGAGIGQLAGGNTKSTLIGAAVGTGAGYIIGNEGDKKKAAAEKANMQAQQNTVTVWITNSNSSQKAVTLTKSGPGYIGPRGEYYPNLPTQDQLRPVYGF